MRYIVQRKVFFSIMIKFYAKEKGQKIDLKSSLLNYFRFKIYLMNSNRSKNIQSKRRSCYNEMVRMVKKMRLSIWCLITMIRIIGSNRARSHIMKENTKNGVTEILPDNII